MKKRNLTREIREKIHGRYGGRCAYCGIEIPYDKMQISLKIPYYRMEDKDDYENYLPSCRLCNYYKKTLTVDEFRNKIANFRCDLMEEPKYQMLQRFSLFPSEVEKADVEFYFETYSVNEKEEG